MNHRKLGTALWRVALALAIWFGFSVFIFLLFERSIEDVAINVLGTSSSYEQRDIWMQEHGYFEPAFQRYWQWLGRLLRGDFFESSRATVPAAEALRSGLGQSALVLLACLIVLVPAGFLVAVLGRRPPGSRLGLAANAFSHVTGSVPDFIWLFALSAIFVFWIPILPGVSVDDDGLTLSGLILPAVIMVLFPLAALARMAMHALERSDEDERIGFLGMARLASCQALIAIPWLMPSLLLVEPWFAISGLGKLSRDSIRRYEIVMLEASAIVALSICILAALLAELIWLLTNGKPTLGGGSVARPAGRRRRAGQAMLRPSALGTVGATIAGLWLLVAAIGPSLAPLHPNATLEPMALPGALHPEWGRFWLGTDHLGRDILSRLLWSARTTLPVAAMASLGACFAGFSIAFAAWSTGWARALLPPLERPAVLSLPMLLVCLFLLKSFGTSGLLAGLAVALVCLPGATIAGLRVLALGQGSIPRALFAELVRRFGLAVSIFSLLGFLWTWPDFPRADWGLMTRDVVFMAFHYPHMVAAPALAIVSLLLGLRLLADSLDKP